MRGVGQSRPHSEDGYDMESVWQGKNREIIIHRDFVFATDLLQAYVSLSIDIYV